MGYFGVLSNILWPKQLSQSVSMDCYVAQQEAWLKKKQTRASRDGSLKSLLKPVQPRSYQAAMLAVLMRGGIESPFGMLVHLRQHKMQPLDIGSVRRGLARRLSRHGIILRTQKFVDTDYMSMWLLPEDIERLRKMQAEMRV